MSWESSTIKLSERQREVLKSITRRGTSPQQLVARARIILLADQGLSNEAIGEQVGYERHQVGRWRRRWASVTESLATAETEEVPKAFVVLIEQILNDAPRPGAPVKFTAEQVTQIIAVACEDPENSGRPVTHWTPAELADEVVQREIVPSISPRQVGRFLNQADLKPHLSRYWLNAVPEDPAAFQEQVEGVCDCYLQARSRYEAGTHTVSVDEMTGIQALERKHPTKPIKPGQAERREFEYKRHGTQCLIGNFEVATGQVITPTVGPTRTEEDFANHIAQTVAADPDAQWVFIVDRLNTHRSETLVHWVAQVCGMDLDLGKKGTQGILETMASRTDFLADPSHRIRFVYVPKHTSWLNQIEIWFSILVRRVLKRGNFTSTENLGQKILAFIDYFNKTLAKPFKWTYTGRPLNI